MKGDINNQSISLLSSIQLKSTQYCLHISRKTLSFLAVFLFILFPSVNSVTYHQDTDIDGVGYYIIGDIYAFSEAESWCKYVYIVEGQRALEACHPLQPTATSRYPDRYVGQTQSHRTLLLSIKKRIRA